MKIATLSLSRSAFRFTDITVDSVSVGWTSVHLACGVSAAAAGEHDTGESPDHNIVMVTQGIRNLESFASGRWRKGIYQPGSIGMTPAMQNDRLRWSPGRGANVVCLADLHLPQRIVEEAAEAYRRAGQPCCTEPFSALCFFDGTVSHAILSMIRAMKDGEPDLYAESAACWIATHLLSVNNRWFDPSSDERDAGVITDQRIARVVEYMSVHLAEPLRLERLATEAGVSKFHFARLFRQRTGTTPLAYLTGLRMQLARRLLKATDMRINDVASACGYPLAMHFHAAFRRRFGESPGEYRQRRQAYFAMQLEGRHGHQDLER